MDACSKCPHANDCLNAGSCLDDINAQYFPVRPGIFPRLMTSTQAATFMKRLREGESPQRLTYGSKEGGKALATPTKFKKHCAAFPQWGAEAARLAKENAKAGVWRGNHRRGKKYDVCYAGLHPMSGDNLVISPTRGTRFCRACWKAKHERPMTPDEITAVKEAATKGWTIGRSTQ
jgi:hypothetical protein